MINSKTASPHPPPELVRETIEGTQYDYYPLGECIVAAPGVCGGRPTVKYTRIDARWLVRALDRGESIEAIEADYAGRVPRRAIEEALRLAEEHGRAFLEQPFAVPDSAA
jgi:uncharacterized protein (DUF433 family)